MIRITISAAAFAAIFSHTEPPLWLVFSNGSKAHPFIDASGCLRSSARLLAGKLGRRAARLKTQSAGD